MKQPLRNKKGFSLIELLIAMFISILIIIAATASFESAFSVRKKARDTQKKVEESRTAMEMMAKNIRMSYKLEYITAGDKKSIRMYNNSQGKCIAYQFISSSGSLNMAIYDPVITDPDVDCSNSPASLSNVVISSGVDGEFNVVQTQIKTSPRIIGKATIRMISGTGSSAQYLQTTASFRDYRNVFY